MDEYKAKLANLARQATSGYIKGSKRMDKDKLYSTLEDFGRMDDDKRRLVVIGCTGSGKSTLLNIVAGWRFVQSKETDYAFVWQKKGASESKEEGGEEDKESTTGAVPIFESISSSESVTKHCSFANVDFRGDPERDLVVVDTPGHDDSEGNELEKKEARDALGAIAADLHNKLKALGHLHTLLVLHNDVISNRLNPATYQILKMVDEKFAAAGGSVWSHVVIGFSKCNGHEMTWRSGLEKKKQDLQDAIKKKIPGCSVAVPVLALGGGEIEPTPPNADETDGLERLWEILNDASPLDTSKLLPFEGEDVKWQKMIDARDEAEARAKAALIYVAILVKLTLLSLLLFWRHMMLPAWLSLLLLNLPGLYDEVAIIGGFVYWIGPQDVMYSLKHFYASWLGPKLSPYVAAYAPGVHANLGLEKAKED